MDGQPSYSRSVILSGPDADLLFDEARRLAASLSCMSEDIAARPCGLCPRCRQIREDEYPYLYTLTPTGKANIITVEQTRDLQSFLMGKAEEGQYKVAVLADAHRMNEESANKLLKTLEEPPDGTMMLLLTSKPDDLLPTIRSRCRMLTFNKAVPLPARIDLELAEDILRELKDEGYMAVFSRAKQLTTGKQRSLQSLLSALEHIIREKMLLAVRTATDLSKTALYIEGLQRIWRAGYLLERNVNACLVMENLFLKLMDLPAS